jgi:hypothetical protein
MYRAREVELSLDTIELSLSKAIHTVERELGVCITEDYLLGKFLNQLEMIEWWRAEEQRQNDSARLR